MKVNRVLDHRAARRLLPDYVSGRRQAQSQALEAHIADCLNCQGWVETYELLAAALGADTVQKHPDSSELSEFSLADSRLSDGARERVAGHLETCTACRHETELVRASVVESAEPDLILPRPVTRRGRLLASVGRLAVAATVVAMFGGWVIAKRWTRIPDEYRLTGRSILGLKAIEANRSIIVENTDVQVGSTLNLKSPVVAIGEGFSVGTGASLVVWAMEPTEEE